MANILIAGGDTASLAVIEAELSAQGHQVISAVDGQDAYERVLAEIPDAVFLEANLPVFNGYETCQLLRGDPQVPPGLPIFVLTAADVDGRALQKVRPTGTLPKRHQAWELQELLSKHLR